MNTDKKLTDRGISHLRPAPFKKFHFGAAYYPEHWDPSMMESDAAAMAAAGFNTVRIAEFAWHLMQPEEDKFDFSFFDRAVACLAHRGIETIMCTPTAAAPRWLTQKYPETLRIDGDGRSLLHGSRQQCCYSSPVYRAFSRLITMEMEKHFRGNKNVIGWQTDNEINCHFSECHCPSCQNAFREFLQKHYGSIDALNDAWGTCFWTLHFDDFSQIETPRPQRPTYSNPGQMLDYRRFLSHIAAMFQRDQVEILKSSRDDWFVFHNGCMKDIDYRGDFGRDIDVLGFDVYPLFDQASTPFDRRYSHCFNLDATRSYTGNFIIPEHQSGPGGQPPYIHNTPEPGELRKLTYTSIARGADSLLYFRWRTCRFGAEEYWCGIMDHDNVPRRRYDEVKKVGDEIKRVGSEILGTHIKIDCAVAVKDYDASTAYKVYPLGLPSPDNMGEQAHKCLFMKGFQVGCVHPEDDLSGLKLYILPHLEIVKPEWVPRLDKFVRDGGVLVIGARTGTRTVDNQIVPTSFPGVLAELAGVNVEDYGVIGSGQGCEKYISLAGGTVAAEYWYETLKLTTAEAYAEWGRGYMAGMPAVSIRRVGKGKVLYAGTYLSEKVFSWLMPGLIDLANLSRPFPGLPEEIEVVRRAANDREIVFLINHKDSTVELDALPEGELIAGADNCVMEPYGVKVIKLLSC